MAGGLLGKLKFSAIGHKRSPPITTTTTNPSPSPSPSPSPAPAPPIPPKEYLCPISGQLMSDPVILPTGQTFERVCIKACIELGVEPPHPLLTTSSSSLSQPPPIPLSPSTTLVPNLALRSSIHTWCYSTPHPFPVPLDLPDALHLVRSLYPSSNCNTTPQPPPPNEEVVVVVEPLSGGTQSTTRSITSSSSSSSSSTTTGEVTTTHDQDDPLANSPLESRILAKLRSPDASEQMEGLALLRRETRENQEQRVALCTTSLLAALRPFLLSRDPSSQSNAAACLVNLSLEPANRTPVVRSGTVPPLVSALKSAHPETRSNAAAALFGLSVDDENKAALGALGALPPLLALLSRDAAGDDEHTCRDALLALYHLSFNCPTNRTKLARLESAGALVRIVKGGGGGGGGALAHVALMVLGNLANCNEGRAALMDAGAVEAVVGVLRRLVLDGGRGGVGGGKCSSKVEQCVAAIYGLSKGSLRFRGIARAVGAEEALAKVAGEEEEEEEEGGGGGGGGGGGEGETVREMARRALRAVRGEDYGGGGGVLRDVGMYGSSGSSESLSTNNVASFPRWSRGGTGGGGWQGRHGGVNSTQF